MNNESSNAAANTNALAAKPAAASDKSPLDYLKHNFREYGMLITLVAIMAFFQYMTGGTLMQPLNLTNLILQNSYIVIMALALLQGQSVGPFPDSFQMLSSGFMPDLSGGDGLRMTSLLLGVALAAVLA